MAAAAKLADKSRGGLWHFVDTVYLIRFVLLFFPNIRAELTKDG